MTEQPQTPIASPPTALKGLSGRLLVLTIFFVMVAEFLIYTPSVSNFRKAYLEERIATARKFLPDFGVAAYCGMGRVPPAELPDVLNDHVQAAET